MKVLGGWSSTVIKMDSGKKTDGSKSAVRRKLERIKQKLRAGARLSASEKAFLKKYAPDLYMKAMIMERLQAENEVIEKERRAREKENQEILEESEEEERITEQKLLEETVKDQEEVQRLQKEAGGVKREDKAEAAENTGYETWWKKEKEDMNVVEEYTHEADIEEILERQKAIRERMGEENRKPGEEQDEETRRLVKEFEEDVWFRTQMPAPPAEFQNPAASFVHVKNVYQNVAQLEKTVESHGVLPRKKA